MRARARVHLSPDSNSLLYEKSTRDFPRAFLKNNYFLYIVIFSIISFEMEQYTTRYEIARNYSIYNRKNWQPAIQVEICPTAFSQSRHISFHLHISPSDFVDCYQVLGLAIF